MVLFQLGYVDGGGAEGIRTLVMAACKAGVFLLTTAPWREGDSNPANASGYEPERPPWFPAVAAPSVDLGPHGYEPCAASWLAAVSFDGAAEAS